MSDKPVEVWMRNPLLYVRECLEIGVTKIAWSRKLLIHRKVDAFKYMTLQYGQFPFEYIICDEMGTQHWESGTKQPIAVYPTWVFGDDFSLLEELCSSNIGLDEEACDDERIDPLLRPVLGQDHKIIIMNVPNASTGIARKFYQVLMELQEDYPEVTIHLHGVASYNVLFGMQLKSVDVDARAPAFVGNLMLPNGKQIHFERTEDIAPWVNLLGYTPGELTVPRNRCMFNIKSAYWASKYFKREIRFKYKRDKVEVVDINSPETVFEPVEGKGIQLKRIQPKVEDKFLCDTCSLQVTCRFYRMGAVCVVPDAETKPLTEYFNTRNADSIIEGLGTLLGTQVARLEEGRQHEIDSDNKLDPEVTKIVNSLFDRGVKLAQLIDPSLRSGPKVQINQQNITGSSPQQLMAACIAELEARGIPRESITPEMIESVLSGNHHNAIEAQATP